MTIPIRRLRRLDLAHPPGAKGPAFLSAASGLVRVQSHLYVIADDELDLGVFAATGQKLNKAPGRFHKLFAGTLPLKKKARKKHKPDLEALALLPPSRSHRHGALLLLGSGSRDSRRRAAILGLDADGAIAGKPDVLDLTPLYRLLEKTLGTLNIEGAVVRDGKLLLFQRGNKGGDNAVIQLSLNQVLAALRTGPAKKKTDKIAFTLTHHDLGEIDGVRLGFTDAALLEDGAIIFTAVAEATDNAYDDGPCRGSAVGLLDAKGRRQWLRRLGGRTKVEGIHARRTGKRIELLLVSDADDATVPACLYRATTAG